MTSLLIREADIFGRWGGDEFLLILPHTNYDKAMEVVEKLRKKMPNPEMATTKTTITVSIGVAQYTEKDSIESIMKHVDDALYQSKTGGRNQVNYFARD